MADMALIALLIFLACQVLVLLDARAHCDRDSLLCFLPPYAVYWALSS